MKFGLNVHKALEWSLLHQANAPKFDEVQFFYTHT